MPRKPEPPTRSMPVARGRPRLTVIGGGQFSLPVAGRVTIGRDTGCEVRIDDPSISRRHVTIEIGERLTAIDLGSSNGSSWRGKRLIANQAVELVYDEVLTVGAVGVVIQRNSPATRERALWGHGYFELRLAEECTRADRAGTTFGLLRVRAPGDAAGKLSAAVREIDVVGTYAPGEWEVLVIDAERPDVEAVARAIEAAIDGAEVALAMFPADGHDAWTLAAAVTAGLTERARKPAKLDPPRLSTTGPMAALVQLIERVAAGDPDEPEVSR